MDNSDSTATHSLFFKLSLGLSLSGMSCLGYVLPNVLKHNHIAFMYIFSLTTGALVSAVTSVMPAYMIRNDMISTTQFYYFQSIMFITMLLLDEIDDCAKGSYWSKVAEDMIRDEMTRYGIMDHDYDIELSRRYNRPMSGGAFSRVETSEDCEFDAAKNIDDDNDDNHNNSNDNTSDGLESFSPQHMATKIIVRPVLVGARVKILSSILILVIGIALGITEGLYIGYKEDMTAIDIEKILACTILMALSLSLYLIVSGGNALIVITCLILIYALAPLIGTSIALHLFTVQDTIVSYNSQVHATLFTLLSGGLLYLSLVFMTPIALGQKENNHDDQSQSNSRAFSSVNKTVCVLCFSVGFIVVNGYGARLAVN